MSLERPRPTPTPVRGPGVKPPPHHSAHIFPTQTDDALAIFGVSLAKNRGEAQKLKEMCWNWVRRSWGWVSWSAGSLASLEDALGEGEQTGKGGQLGVRNIRAGGGGGGTGGQRVPTPRSPDKEP